MENNLAIKLPITADTKVGELKLAYPQIIHFLAKQYKFHCFNCFLAPFETLREGSRVHGFTEQDLQEMLAEINQQITSLAGK